MAAGGGALDIFSQIESLVSDRLQVVSYKWLSRNFCMSSNHAKRLLKEFVEKHGNELQVIYTLSGWLRNNPETYQIRLASAGTLAEVKEDFEDNCSVQVYSVQACIPKDLAVLWSAEFVQAEELFNQPSSRENCLRDNRFGGVSNSFVQRTANVETLPAASLQARNSMGLNMQSKVHAVSKDQLILAPKRQAEQQNVVPSRDKAVKIESGGTDQYSKPTAVKESAIAIHTEIRKCQSEKASSGSGRSLADMWDRASVKPKLVIPAVDSTSDIPHSTLSAEAQICALEATDVASSGDDDGSDVICKREKNGGRSRKRKIVIDYSDEDEEENVVSLASPDPPNGASKAQGLVLEKKNLNFEEPKEDETKVKQEGSTERNFEISSVKAEMKSTPSGISLQEKSKKTFLDEQVDKSVKNDSTCISTSPQRRKVLKTQVDERGREVTDVVWEEAAAGKNTEKDTTTIDPGKRPPIGNNGVVARSNGPSNPVSKVGSKKTAKGAGKDAKQGNILAFFKKI